MAQIDAVLEKGKEYEYLASTFDPAYNDLVDAIEIVKDFIIQNNLIVYGGTAIDFALRLKGDKIYPDDMLKIPDLDFYSYNNVEHSYQLADALFNKGYKEARAINAQHMETMRVDLVDNHFIADITYRPKEIFDTLPYLEYNGMRIIHPLFQRIDSHASLSFPYDNVPREVIFERWSKDVSRFNKLDSYYPVAVEGDMIAPREVSQPEGVRKYVLCGFAAYALLYSEFTKFMAENNASVPDSVIPAKFSLSGAELRFDTVDCGIEIIHFDIQKAARELGLTGVHIFEPYVNMIPQKITGKLGKNNITIYSTRNRLLSSNTVKYGDISLRIANIQYLLKQFLSMHFVAKSTPKMSNTYLSRYKSLLLMINHVEKVMVARSPETETSPFFPTVHTYGNENINLAREIALNRLYADLDGIATYKIPMNYYPARSLARCVPHPAFNPEDVPFFRERGRELKSDADLTH